MRELPLIEALEQVRRVDDPRLGRWRGDDGAVVQGRAYAVTSVDTMVEGVHFPALADGIGTLADFGHRALAGGLPRLAAMGAEPGEAYLALLLPPRLGQDDVLTLFGAAHALASASGTTIA